MIISPVPDTPTTDKLPDSQNDIGYKKTQPRFVFKYVNFIVFCALLVAVPLTVYVAGQQTELRRQAKTSTPVRGQSGDLWADIVLGQQDFGEIVPKEKTNFKAAGPGGVIVDTMSTPQRIYVMDGMNSRILGYSSLGVCQGNAAKACSSDADCGADMCQIQVGGVNGKKKADIVIGQPGFTRSACNGDGSGQNLPDRKSASTMSLCMMAEATHSPYEGGSFSEMALDTQGNLYVADFFNNRVLMYRSPFTTDTVADDVWGQTDFQGVACNKGQGNPDATTLCFENQWAVAGVAIDAQGNLWVADNGNNRVLRFPKTTGIAKSADLVLGQISFTTRYTAQTCSDIWNGATCNAPNSRLNGLFNPVAVRVHEGKVYVVDSWNHRVIVYDNPATGATGRLFASGLKLPSGIEVDTINGGLWINNTLDGVNRVVLFDFNGTKRKVIGATPGVNESVQDNRAGVGITKNGDVLVPSSEGVQDVFYYRHPIDSQTNLPHAKFFNIPGRHNYLSDKGLYSPRGITVRNGQLIIADAQRIAYWNIPNGISDLSSFKPASGVAGTSSFTSEPVLPDNVRFSADSRNNLWVAGVDSTIRHYTLPLSSGQLPDATVQTKNFKFLGAGASVGKDIPLSNIYVDKDGKHLWLAAANKSRVIRVRIPQNLSGDYIIDAIIGGPDVPDRTLGWEDLHLCSTLDAKFLCYPGSVVLDNFNNVYVSDTALEFHGTYKLFRFDQSLFPVNNPNLLVYYNDKAAQTFSGVGNWEPAFDSTNRMVSGLSNTNSMDYNGPNSHRYPFFIHNIASKTGPTLQPDGGLNDIYNQAFNSAFDETGNLYVSDITWGRVLIYKNPFNISLYGQLSSTMPPNGPTTFTFAYNGPATTHHIDVSTLPDMSWNTYLDFGTGTGTTITVNDPIKWTGVYTCGRNLYWRIRSESGGATYTSSIQTTVVGCGPTPTPTPTATPSPTPAPVSYTTLNATFAYPSPAKFSFTYTGPAATHHIDVSTLPDMSWNTYMDFGLGTGMTISVTDPTKWTGVYACGRTLYWRVRQGNYFSPTVKSAIKSTTVPCPTSTSTPTPTRTPTPTKTPSPPYPMKPRRRFPSSPQFIATKSLPAS